MGASDFSIGIAFGRVAHQASNCSLTPEFSWANVSYPQVESLETSKTPVMNIDQSISPLTTPVHLIMKIRRRMPDHNTRRGVCCRGLERETSYLRGERASR